MTRDEAIQALESIIDGRDDGLGRILTEVKETIAAEPTLWKLEDPEEGRIYLALTDVFEEAVKLFGDQFDLEYFEEEYGDLEDYISSVDIPERGTMVETDWDK